MSSHPLEEIFHPQSIAVVGASENPRAAGYCFIDVLQQHEFKGKIYPVNPRYSEILGLKCYPSLRDVPGSVDYVISCIPAREVLGMLEDCSQKMVKAAHLFTARFSETGRPEAAELEQEILKQARKWNIRLIGPNCRGVYYPRQGISFYYDFPKESGVAGLISQTGGGSGIFVELASLRGVRFSKAISYGNGVDLNESDYLEYLARDPETKVIMMYVEGVRDGKRFFNTLRHAAGVKPVIVLKGGRGKSGARMAASHTASLAGSMGTWKAMVTQAGAIFAENIEEMIDLVVSFYFLPQISGLRVGVAGGSGGPSVLGADDCEEAGLDVIPLPSEIREELKSMGAPGWDWIGNPADMSMLGGFEFTGSKMLQMMGNNQNFDLLIAYTITIPGTRKEIRVTTLQSEVNDYINVKKGCSRPLLVVVADKSIGINDYDDLMWKAVCEARTNLIAANIPIYPTIDRAAKAAKKMVDYYRRRDARVG
ncbi:MAG: CoA-binding protein [Dehalococcoidales bacterium]|nr:CoA-binding protein [Dehalococcoidales bacterium]